MAKSAEKLEKLAQLLDRTGGDAQRIDAVRKTQAFRTSWVELAKTLSAVRTSKRYTKWGYADFYEYASKELTLKQATVDKLTISYHTLQNHAPHVLQRDGVAAEIPSYQTIDYFSRAVGSKEDAVDSDSGEPPPKASKKRGSARPPAQVSPERVDELKHAVFDEGQPLKEIRNRFDEVFFPKPQGQEDLDVHRRAAATTRKLLDLLPQVEGLAPTKLDRVRNMLHDLGEHLQKQIGPMRERVKSAQPARSSPAPEKSDKPEAAREGRGSAPKKKKTSTTRIQA